MSSKGTLREPAARTRRSSGSRTRPQRIDRPKLLIVAGPNGSGKTTVFQNAVVEALGRTVWIINPDLLAERIRQVESLSLRAANLEAVRRIEKWLEASIEAHQTVGVETVLSTPKYRRLVAAAQRKQFDIALFYVFLNSPKLNVARVRLRVRKGGHDVPVAKILSRRTRSLEQLPWFLREADAAWLYDNSGAKPRLVGTKKDGIVAVDPSAARDIKDAIGKSPRH